MQRGVVMSMSRRDVCSLLPALLPVVGLHAFGAQGETLPSAAFEFDKLPVVTHEKAEFRSIMKGKLATGETVEVHETKLPPNGAPHPPHHHVHSEMWLIREGTVELTINGAKSVIGPGGLGFVRTNEEHGIRNVGSTAANYYVVTIGPGADS
jgi:mannose-6-phosphate isomerase-like protein (cupin superfamily)